jgi:hypothetical protein
MKELCQAEVVESYLNLKDILKEKGYEFTLDVSFNSSRFLVYHYSDLPFYFSTVGEVRAFIQGLGEKAFAEDEE